MRDFTGTGELDPENRREYDIECAKRDGGKPVFVSDMINKLQEIKEKYKNLDELACVISMNDDQRFPRIHTFSVNEVYEDIDPNFNCSGFGVSITFDIKNSPWILVERSLLEHLSDAVYSWGAYKDDKTIQKLIEYVNENIINRKD